MKKQMTKISTVEKPKVVRNYSEQKINVFSDSAENPMYS